MRGHAERLPALVHPWLGFGLCQRYTGRTLHATIRLLSWVQETTLRACRCGSLLIAAAGGVATYLGILLALSLLTGRARAWPASRTAGGPCDGGCAGNQPLLDAGGGLLVGASFLDLPGAGKTG